MRTTIKNIIKAIGQTVAPLVPDVEHYIGRLEEDFSRPAFLYVPVFFGESKANYFTSTKNVEIQMIYFGSTDGCGQQDYIERLDVEAALDTFLSQHTLEVNDRHLHFTYEVKEADKQMAIYLTFRFLDEALDQAYIDECNEVLAGSAKVSVSVKPKLE